MIILNVKFPDYLVECEHSIKYIFDNTSMQVALIPHVVWDRNNDLIPTKELYDYFVSDNLVYITKTQ